MEVILKEDVVGLGYKDDVVTVKNGYGRNFLIPTGKAIIATEAAKKILAENLRQRAHKIAAIKKELVYIKAIKEIGNYTAIVRLHKEVAVEIPVEVLSDAPKAEEKKEEAPAPAEAPAEEEAPAEA